MNQTTSRIQLAVRAETALIKAQLKRALNSLLLILVAGVFALLALGYISFSGYQYLLSEFTPSSAALIVGVVALALAGVLIGFALQGSGESDEQRIAAELRELNYQAIGKDLEQFRSELGDFRADVRRIRHTIAFVVDSVTRPLGWLIRLLEELGSVSIPASKKAGRSEASDDEGTETSRSED